VTLVAEGRSDRVSRGVWTILVPFVAVLAVLAVVTMVRENVSGDDAEAATADTVEMSDIKFNPATITVAQGTELVFDNKDAAPHTVTADDGSIDSGIIDPGQAFRLKVEEAFEYHCEVHPAMKAAVELEG
jgi:plastocyanin